MERIAAAGMSKHAVATLQGAARFPVEYVKAAPATAVVLQRAAFQASTAMLRSKHPKIRAAGWEGVGKGSLGTSTGLVELAAGAADLFIGRDHALVGDALTLCHALLATKTTDEGAEKRALFCGARLLMRGRGKR